MLRPQQIDPDRAFVLVIDLQEKLLPLVPGADRIIRAAGALLQGTRIFELPVLATEQYPKGLGHTEDSVYRHLETGGARIVEKVTFSACGQPAVREALAAIDRPQVLVTGIEAHICVQQTCLDLLSMEYDVFVCADAVGARGRLDCDLALARLRHEGAHVATVESVLFELCNRCDTDRFKELLDIIKANPPYDEG